MINTDKYILTTWCVCGLLFIVITGFIVNIGLYFRVHSYRNINSNQTGLEFTTRCTLDIFITIIK